MICVINQMVGGKGVGCPNPKNETPKVYYVDDIDSIEVVDDDKMLLGDFQAQVSGDGGLNNIPIKAATTTVCALPIRHTLSYLLLSITYEPILPSIIALLLLLGSNPFHGSGG